MALKIYRLSLETDLELPVADQGIKAGFPSPAQDYFEYAIDLNKELIKNPSATFLGIVDGDSLIDLGITDGSLAVIDRSLTPKDGDLAVCYLDGEYTMKRVKIERDVIWLVPGNKNYSSIKVTEDSNFMIWGVVRYCILDMYKKGFRNVRTN